MVINFTTVFILVFVILSVIVFILFLIFKIFEKLFGQKFNKKAAVSVMQDKAGEENLPKHRIADNSIGINFENKKELKETSKDAVTKEKVKEEKSIQEGLAKLKTDDSEKKETLESKMPSRTENQERFPTPEAVLNMEGGQQDLPYMAQGFEKNGVVDASHTLPTQKIPENKSTDSSMFQGKPEVSRIKLAQELRADPKIWQASRQVGLNMSPVERAKLVKQVFSSAYGMNISKTDLRQGIRKLNQKMLGTKDLGEHAKIRKEIKFFKKIGGIK